MITISASPMMAIRLGRIGENERQRVAFDVSALLAELPGASFTVINQGPGDAVAYPCPGVTVEDGVLYWPITSAELQQTGRGKCELIVTVGDVVAKSVIYSTQILEALDGSGETPSEWGTWQTEFAGLVADAQTAAAAAESAAESAEASVVHGPRIEGGVWYVYDGQSGEYVSTGVRATGADGVSPTIAVTDITGGHRITITDATGPHSFDVMDGDAADAPVQDVRINGASVLDAQGVAAIPVVSGDVSGVVKVNNTYGIALQSSATGMLRTYPATNAEIKHLQGDYRIIPPAKMSAATFYGLAVAANDTTQSQSSNAVGTYTDSAKSAISEMLNGSVTVSGTTPTITALPGIRYVCGECATLDITLPVSGIVDVVFESGSTATVLSGLDNVSWANGFDPEHLDANTTYEINIADGLGVAVSWT